MELRRDYGRGLAVAQFRVGDSYLDFAHACFSMALRRDWPLYLGAGRDHCLRAAFTRLHELKYKQAGVEFMCVSSGMKYLRRQDD